MNQHLGEALKWNVLPFLPDFWGRGIFRFLQSPTITRISPLSWFEGIFFSLCPFNHVRARLQVRGLARGTAMSIGTWVKCKKEQKSLCELSQLINLKEGVVYFDQLLCAARTQKLVELLFFSRFHYFCSFIDAFCWFQQWYHWKRFEMEFWMASNLSVPCTKQGTCLVQTLIGLLISMRKNVASLP